MDPAGDDPAGAALRRSPGPTAATFGRLTRRGRGGRPAAAARRGPCRHGPAGAAPRRSPGPTAATSGRLTRRVRGGRRAAAARRGRSSRCFAGSTARDPRQYGLDFGLWTRSIVATLIEQKFGVHLGVTAVGEMLALAPDAAEAVAARLPARPASHRALAARDLSRYCTTGEGKRGRRLLLGRVRLSCRHRARQDLGRQRARPRLSNVPGNANRSPPLRR